MSEISQIMDSLKGTQRILSTCSDRLQNECNEISSSLNRVSAAFGDQAAGVNLSCTLYSIISALKMAEGSLYTAGQDITNFIVNASK